MKSETLAAKAEEKALRGKVQKQTFPPRLEIPQKTRDSHFHTASTAEEKRFEPRYFNALGGLLLNLLSLFSLVL
jgi:hypothetical protein